MARPGSGFIDHSRLIVLYVLVSVAFGLLLLRAFSVQVIQGYSYLRRAQQITRRSEVLPTKRGRIYDRNVDEPLVDNVSAFAVDFNPAEIPPQQIDMVITRLASVLPLSEGELRRRLPETAPTFYQPIELIGGLDIRAIAAIAEQADQLPGVTWRSEPLRRYRLGETMSHVLGYVGDITREELHVLYNQGYSRTATIGKAGVEAVYDDLLRGRDGQVVRTVDVRGRDVAGSGAIIEEAVLGRDVVLTLDRRMQQIVEEALADQIGAAVILDPATGEVLAMATYPRFDPNAFFRSDSAQVLAGLRADRRAPFLNRTIQSTAAPASTFKVIVMAAVIEEDAFPLDQTIMTTGSYVLGNRTILEWEEDGFGPLNLLDGLAMSSNQIFVQMGVEELGIQRMVSYASAFGFGSPTHIDLPGEVAGLLPTPQWKLDARGEPWVPGDTANMALGQGFLSVTPLQLACAIAGLVNDGVIFRPHVLKQTRDPRDGSVIDTYEPELLRVLPLSEQTLATVREGLRRVTTTGTAAVAITTDATAVAGKTGTAEVGLEESWDSWFVSYAPAELPPTGPTVGHSAGALVEGPIVLVMMIDASNEWKWWAPIASNVVYHAIFRGISFAEAVDEVRRLPNPWLVNRLYPPSVSTDEDAP